ncbi:MAG: hypothetical protein RLZZ352_1785 [Pseudomonadota bacterium]|jgi:hypothetical protein
MRWQGWLHGLRWLCLLLTAAASLLAHAVGPEVLHTEVQRSSDAVYLSARLRLAPAPAVEEALLKGVPLYFVWQADIYHDRWYWTDKRVASVTRTLRLVYQPLTRRWRLSLATGGGSSVAGLQYALHQNYDSLTDALAGVGRVSRWRLADESRLRPGERHYLEWRFSLDLTLLPRPFQIGMATQPEWDIGVERTQRLPDQPEPAGPLETGRDSGEGLDPVELSVQR